jgi:hypothetical protein
MSGDALPADDARMHGPSVHGEDEAIATGQLAKALSSLQALARGLLNRDLSLQACERNPEHGVALRPVLTHGHLLLPPHRASALNDVAAHEHHRATVAHAVAHLRFSLPAAPSKGLKPMTIALASAIEDARVERLLLRDHPGMRGWFLAPLRRALRMEDTSFAALLSRMDLALLDPDHRDEHFWVNKARTLFEQQAADLHDPEGFRGIALTLAGDLGQMRVPFRPQQYQVSAPYRDDNSYLWTHAASEADPPPELQLTVPAPPPPLLQVVPEAEGTSPPTATEEMVLSRHLYPEWDRRTERLRPDWCTVLDKRPPWRQGLQATAMQTTAKVLPLNLRRTRRLDGGQRLRRQRDGEELDLNAAIAFMIDHRSHRAPEPRCFIRQAATDTQASILVLLDLSQSTADRLGIGSPSFLDVEKQAALMLAEAVVHGGDRIAIHGFSSNTRAEVSYYRLLDFGQALDATARTLLSSAPARHSTRMGAALRHATASLADEPHALKAVLLLTDGAPSVIDVHEPRYLVEDACQAVLEARAAGVQVHGLAVGREADAYARRIFGWRGYHLVDDPMSLPARLCGLYRWLTAA